MNLHKVGILHRIIFAAGALVSLAFLAPFSQAAGSDSTDRLIVKFRDPATYTAAPSPELTSSAGVSAGVELSYSHAIANGAHVLKIPQNSALTEVQAMAERMRANPDIDYAEPDQLMQIFLVPNDTQYANQWHYKEYTTEIGGANLPAAWDISTGSASIVAAVIDTGLVAHADIDSNILDGSGRVVAGYDFISVTSVANDGDGRDSNPSDPGDYTVVNECYAGWPGSSSSWHGTHVAGTIGALSNNGSGVAGINWAAKIQPLRVLGRCGGYVSDIADAMYWAAGLSVPGVPANATPAKVMNLSLGGSAQLPPLPPCSTTYQNAIDAAVGAGAVVVVAAGNNNANASGFQPANCNNVITVAATQRTGARASYSNYGSVVEIAAPGGGDGNGVLSTLNTGTTTPVATPTGDTYAYYQGTSMATPHVVGVVSLMFGVNPSLTPAQVLSILQSTARAFPTGTGRDCTTSICGAGIVNAAAAVAAAAPGVNNPPNTPASPSPANAATGVSTVPTLSWTGGDPDAGQTVTYDVYFGTSASPPLLVSNKATTSHAPGTLVASTLYYWRIVARDNLGATTSGPTWSFTTGAPTYSVSGRVVEAVGSGFSGVAGVTISFTGAATASTTTNATGNYSLSGLANGAYTVTPSKSGYNFAPVNRAVTVSGANVTGQNFTGTPGPANNPPNTPASPSPANAATGVSLTPTLSWTGGDPDVGNTVTYDIYFGTAASPPLVVSNNATTSYAPGALVASTLYYWRIVARDNSGATTSGPTWSFTTTAANNPPNTPASPSPANAATGVSLTPTLGWTGGDPDVGNTVTYDIYFGTAASPPLVVSNNATTSYAPGTLVASTLYYWRIVARDNLGATTSGPTWSFTTTAAANNPPNTPASPSPANAATGVSLTPTLGWTGGDPDVGNTVTYDIYFGTAASPPLVVSNNATTSYAPGTLVASTLYYWRIVARDNLGATTSGPTWSFTTLAGGGSYSLSGRVVEAVGSGFSGIAGVTVNLTGAATASTTTNATGNYSFSALANGGYTLTPSKSGYNFSPASRNATISGANVAGQNFTGAPGGPVNNPPNTPASPSPANGATGVSTTPTLSWTGGDPDAGNTVTYDIYFGTSASPPLVVSNNATTGYVPGTLIAGTLYYWRIVARDNLGATTNGPTWNFITAGGGGGGSFTISGRVTQAVGSAFAGLSGVTIGLTGAATASAVTDGNGNYSFSALANGAYILTPSKTGYTFSPVNRAVTVSGANVTGQNFAATGP